MISIDLKSRFRNKAFILSIISAVVLLVQQCGFKDLIPSNYADIVNTLLTIGTMLGIIVDTSTPGINDQVVATTTIQATNTEENVQTTASTTEINNTVDANSASSKITVDNPDNTQQVGATVNAMSAATPQ